VANQRTLGSLGLHFLPTIDSGTMCRSESFPPGLDLRPFNSKPDDEISPIAAYMAMEINANAHGEYARRILTLNTSSTAECINEYSRKSLVEHLLAGPLTELSTCLTIPVTDPVAALALWTAKVIQNGPWDHKPQIAKRFHPRVPNGSQVWHFYRGKLYFYDVWSNIHYGYVGKAVGFSDSVLLDGAGLEQIGSELGRGNLPKLSFDMLPLRKFDDPSDRAAIQMGIRLQGRKPEHIDAQDLLDLVVDSNEITWKYA